MTDKELAKALLHLGSSELHPACDALTQKILTRDRRRVWLVAALTLFFWVVSAVVLFGFMFALLGMISEMQQSGRAPADPLVSAVYKFLLVLAGSLESLVFAFLCTILLMFLSRRATLRQVNANLAVISRQLKEFQQRPGYPPGSSTGQPPEGAGS
jgi:amino acid transporter